MIKRAFLVFGLLAAQCLPALGAGETIVVVGDAFSSGCGLDSEQSWVALLESHLGQQAYGYEVVNASIAGDTSAGGLARPPSLLMQADRVHPNAAGQRPMFENVWAVLSELL